MCVCVFVCESVFVCVRRRSLRYTDHDMISTLADQSWRHGVENLIGLGMQKTLDFDTARGVL